VKTARRRSIRDSADAVHCDCFHVTSSMIYESRIRFPRCEPKTRVPDLPSERFFSIFLHELVFSVCLPSGLSLVRAPGKLLVYNSVVYVMPIVLRYRWPLCAFVYIVIQRWRILRLTLVTAIRCDRLPRDVSFCLGPRNMAAADQ
jgi:hypothetical protein